MKKSWLRSWQRGTIREPIPQPQRSPEQPQLPESPEPPILPQPLPPDPPPVGEPVPDRAPRTGKFVRYDLKTHPRVMKILALTIFCVLSLKMKLLHHTLLSKVQSIFSLPNLSIVVQADVFPGDSFSILATLQLIA